jgi:restriction system protein
MVEEQGAEVKITRRSKEQGFDAIIYREDTLFFSKVIVQAKRYNGLVPPNHVRELWGTMDNERAGSGILITTGWFGTESYEWKIR